MSILSWFDNRTLISCQFLLASIFTIVLFTMRRAYPNLHGINIIGFSFFFGVPGALLATSHGANPSFLSVIVGNAFMFGSFIFLYRGILRFIGSRRTSPLPWLASAGALVVLYYYGHVHLNPAPCIVAVSFTIGLIRALIASELFRKSASSASPSIMRLFAASLWFFSVVSLNRAVMTVLHGPPANSLEANTLETTILALGLLSICLTGIFFLVLASSELIAHTREESQRDPLSGALNRRGIEHRLALQLAQVAGGNQQLSVALIDIDHFKSINDLYGHAAGDEAIRDVSQSMLKNLRRYDALGRYGGDEFLLLLPNTRCIDAVSVADRLSHMASNLKPTQESPALTLSIGITEAVASDDAHTLIARADKALYQAKNDGRNRRRFIIKDAVVNDIADPSASSSLTAILMPATGSGMPSR